MIQKAQEILGILWLAISKVDLHDDCLVEGTQFSPLCISLFVLMYSRHACWASSHGHEGCLTVYGNPLPCCRGEGRLLL